MVYCDLLELISSMVFMGIRLHPSILTRIVSLITLSFSFSQISLITVSFLLNQIHVLLLLASYLKYEQHA